MQIQQIREDFEILYYMVCLIRKTVYQAEAHYLFLQQIDKQRITYVMSDASEGLPEAPTTVGFDGTDAPVGLPEAPTTVELDGTDAPEGLSEAPTTVGFDGTDAPEGLPEAPTTVGLDGTDSP